MTDAEKILSQLKVVMEKLERLEQQQPSREFYTTAEASRILGRSEWTVREYCRLGRVNAEKKLSGRGSSKEWTISHEELLRIQSEGLLPRPEKMHRA